MDPTAAAAEAATEEQGSASRSSSGSNAGLSMRPSDEKLGPTDRAAVPTASQTALTNSALRPNTCTVQDTVSRLHQW